ncbi:MAG: T9SS type A sorting domain-containing protein, partial [Bacteroidales bacterium]|nr:T9SS type A sorting domain-containing protein [Bacteroidales bacterium]
YKVWIDDLKISHTTVTISDNINDNVLPFSVYPNPAKETLYIETVQHFDRLTIFNAKGQIVLKTNSHQKSLDISNLAGGIYYMELTVNGQKMITKFIKA